MKKIKTALIGYGSVAQSMHAPLIHFHDVLELYGVLERSGDQSIQKYPHIRLFKDMEGLLADKSIELVVIATPNEVHFDQAQQALSAGKHVVIDKPMTIKSSEGQVLWDLAKSRNLLLSTYQNRRWDGDFLTVKKLLSESLLGRIAYVESHFDRFRPIPKENWREKIVPGSGILYDLGSHLIDQVLVLFGSPDWLYAEISTTRQEALVDDFFDISIQFGPIKTRLTAGVLVNAPTPRFLVLGDKGSYQKFGLDVQEVAFKAGNPPLGPDWGKENEKSWGKIYLNGEEPATYPTEIGDYRKYYHNIADVILNQAELQVKPWESINCLKIMEAARLSHQEGRRIYKQEIGLIDKYYA
ncbi:Gfo/Idh/MocA family oxidoreductase [Pararhodonellum marinum]|uniref:Gfo/Idh/MocA family oxidoreductase n=1 Tax=Pararhodonellum marinum TaxID=2755358 RepID=UPI0018909F76|nr:Gfo/Idh/MocA family oxidoreductase [Pararhodonellum marinum]